MKIYIKNKIHKLWYWLMTPLAYFFSSKKENMRYEKRNNKITEQQSIKWISEDIVRYLIKYKKSTIKIMICTYSNDDHFWGDCDLNGTAPYYLKRKKTKMAFYKFTKTLDFQERIANELKKNKFINVVEEVETLDSWKRIENYVNTVAVKHKSS